MRFVAFLIGMVICIYLYRKEWGWWFIIQTTLLEMSVFAGISHFVFGISLFPNLPCISEILERGSFEAMSSIAGTIGIGNFLFVWVYSERDKLILGRPQIELIQIAIGKKGYGGSVLMHFAATVLCLFFAKSGVRESTVFSFLALIWGCCLQAYICEAIVFNRTKRDEKAIERWNQDYQYKFLMRNINVPLTEELKSQYIAVLSKDIVCLKKMTSCLEGSECINDLKYQETFNMHFVNWLIEFSSLNLQSEVRYGIESISSVLQCIFKKAGDGISALQDVFTFVSNNVTGRNELSESRKICAAELFSYGIVHCLWSVNTNNDELYDFENSFKSLIKQTRQIAYYVQRDDSRSYSVRFLWAVVAAVEWYLFLNRKLSVISIPQFEPLSKKVVYTSGLFSLFEALFTMGTERERDFGRIAYNLMFKEKK